MAEESNKPVKKSLMPDETTLVKTEKPKPMEVKAPAQMQTIPKPEEKAIQANLAKTETAKTPETPKAEAKAESKKESDPAKEFVDGIMAEMALKGASKKRLIKMLVEQYGMDKQRVMFKLKRALITERYAAAHAEAGH